MTQDQIEWARQHDWFACAHEDGSVEVLEQSEQVDCLLIRRTFSDFEELREWAGY